MLQNKGKHTTGTDRHSAGGRHSSYRRRIRVSGLMVSGNSLANGSHALPYTLHHSVMTLSKDWPVDRYPISCCIEGLLHICSQQMNSIKLHCHDELDLIIINIAVKNYTGSLTLAPSDAEPAEKELCPTIFVLLNYDLSKSRMILFTLEDDIFWGVEPRAQSIQQ